MVRRAPRGACRDGQSSLRWPRRPVYSVARRCLPVRSWRDGHDDATPVECIVNGAAVARRWRRRSDAARLAPDEVGLTGTKEGAPRGSAAPAPCTSTASRPVLPGARGPGPRRRRSTTIEGLPSDGELHPLQQAFVDQFAAQCGFCIPGFPMSGDRLLQSAPTRRGTTLALGAVRQPLRCARATTALLRRGRAGGGRAAVTGRRMPARPLATGAQRRRRPPRPSAASTPRHDARG